MSVVVNAHEQLLVTVTSVVFSNEFSEIGTQFLIISGYGERKLSIDRNDPHIMMVRLSKFLLLPK